MSKYNHMFDIAFSVVSGIDEPYRLVSEEPAVVREALQKRINSISDEELKEALGWCDTYVCDTYGEETNE